MPFLLPHPSSTVSDPEIPKPSPHPLPSGGAVCLGLLFEPTKTLGAMAIGAALVAVAWLALVDR